MFWLNLRRIVRSGFINYWRNGAVSLAAVTALSVTLFVIGGIVVSRAFLLSSLEMVVDKVDISVYFEPQASQADIDSLEAKIRLLPEVKTITYHSRENELADFRTRHAGNALILQSLDEVGNPLGARFSIMAHDPGQYATIAKALQAEQGVLTGDSRSLVDHVSFKSDIANRLIQLTAAANRVGLVLVLVLVFLSVLVTFNTISLAIYTAREEISVMRLVGADNHYIRGPFVVTGAISGIMAAFVALIVLYPALLWIRQSTLALYGGLDLVSYYLSNFGLIFALLLLSGFGLGVIASWLAIRKHLII